MKLRFISIIIGVVLLTACGEYNKVLKNPDWQVRYEYGRKYYDEGKFSRSATLLEDIVTYIKGNTIAEEALYMLAQSYYKMKDYSTASQYFQQYYKTYQNGQYTEFARYFSAHGLYLDSPDPRLDQTQTYEAIKQLQEFMEYYPQSDRKEEAQQALFELQEKLALKELMAVRLYYNLGSYVIDYHFPGGNYTSCVIAAENALRSYPYSKYREDLLYFSLKAKYDLAQQSIDEKKSIRYRSVIDDYFTFMNDFSDSKYVKEIKRIYEHAKREISD